MTLRIIAGRFKGRLLKAPKSVSTRPTQGMLREAVFNICQNAIPEARFLDLYAGSGAMGLEALSRGAAHATFVEQNRNALICLRENIATLQLEAETTLLPIPVTRAVALLTQQSAHFECIYIEPPSDHPPDLELILPLLAPNATLFLEERHDPKNPPQPLHFPSLHLKDSRRFGIALLSIFHYNPKL